MQAPSDNKNSLWLSTQFILSLVFSLVTLKLNISHFGNEIFGIWIAIASIWGFSFVLDFGFGTAVVKYVAQYSVIEKEKINKLLSSSFFVFLFIGLSIFIIGNLAAYIFYLSNKNLVPANLVKPFTITSVILGISFYIQYLVSFFKAVFEGHSNFVLSSKLILMQNTLVLFGIILISILKLNIISLAVVYLCTTTIALVSYILIFITKLKKYKIKYSLFDFRQVKEIIGFSLSVQSMSIFNSLIDPVIKYMISYYYNIGLLPAYEIARKFAVAISGLFFNAFKIVLPKASALLDKSQLVDFINNDLVRFCRLGIIYSGITFGIFSLPIVMLIHYFFGIKEAILIFIILSLPESINNFGYATYNFLLGVGRTYFLAGLQFINLLVVALFLFIGFKIFQNPFGLLGYFVSVLIGNTLMVLYLHRNWKINLLDFIHKVKLYKLLMLIFLLVCVMVTNYYNLINLYILFIFLSAVSYFIFRSDFKIYFKLLFASLREKVVAKIF